MEARKIRCNLSELSNLSKSVPARPHDEDGTPLCTEVVSLVSQDRPAMMTSELHSRANTVLNTLDASTTTSKNPKPGFFQTNLTRVTI